MRPARILYIFIHVMLFLVISFGRLQHKCDVINMSYGEYTMFPDYGRFVELVDEVIP